MTNHIKRLLFLALIHFVSFGFVYELKQITHGPVLIRNLVFEGGGIKGLAYVGALEKSLEANLFSFSNIQNIAGTSVGAITAVLVSLNYSMNDIRTTLESVNFDDFLDSDFKDPILELKSELKENSPTINLLLTHFFFFKNAWNEFSQSFGLFPGASFRDWIEDKIHAKLGVRDATFRDLDDKILNGSAFKYIFLTGSNLNTTQSEIFSHVHTPDMVIADAVRISMSLPILFYPHHKYVRNKKNQRVIDPNKHQYVDGGLLNNYPIRLFDTKEETDQIEKHHINMETLGFRLVSNELKSNYEDSCKNEMNSKQSVPFIVKLFNIYQRREENLHSERSQDKERTVYIDSLDISALDFDLSREKKEKLILSGRSAVDDYLSKRKKAKKTLLNDIYKLIWSKATERSATQCNVTKKLFTISIMQQTQSNQSLIQTFQNDLNLLIPLGRIISYVKLKIRYIQTEWLIIYFLLLVILYLLLVIRYRYPQKS